MTRMVDAMVLVSLNVRTWTGRKEDKRISAEVARDHNVKGEAGKYSKVLVAPHLIKPVTQAVSELRTFHYSRTLPWADEGPRVCPVGIYEEYKTGMELRKDVFGTVSRDFVNHFDDVLQEARTRLNGMFDQRDYPRNIASKFGCSYKFTPLADPNSSDFRLNIGDIERAKLRSEIEEAYKESSTVAVLDLYQRLGTAVQAMATRLASYRIDPLTNKTEGRFHASLVENLRDLVSLIPAMNFTADQRLEALRKDVEKSLCAFDADTLREVDTTREAVAKEAKRIGDSLAEFMV